jgi:xylulokinase
MNKYLLGIDIGTSSVKTIICDVDKYKIIASETAEHDLYSPFPGWTEENPEDWWENTVKTVSACIAKSKVEPKQIAGIGTTGMLPAFVLLDEKGEVLRPSIQQSDSRTYKEMDYLREKIDPDTFFNITGCSLNQQMIAPKILWMKENEPEIFSKTRTILGSYDYINYKLTGNFSLESNWALESGMFDIKTGDWSEDILRIIGINKNYFPKVNQPSTVIGTVTKEAAKKIGALEGIPVIAGVADMIASAFMAGIQNPGDLIIKLGSAGDITFSSDHLITDKRLFIDYHVIPDNYYLSGCMASSGSLIKWFKKQFISKPEISYADLDREAEKISSGSDGLIVLPYFIGEKTPIFDPIARGVIFGLTIYHTIFHVYRAILEAIGFGFQHHIDVIKEISLEPKNVIAADGGASSKAWVQMLSNMFGLPIKCLKQNPDASLGAAFIAGIATKCFSDWSESKEFIDVSHAFYPDETEHIKYQKYYSLYRKLYFDLKENFKTLNKIA